MKKLINTLVLTYKHCQSMRKTDEAKPSEADAVESELSVSAIPIEERKEEEKTLMLSSALADLIAVSEEDKQISCDGERWKKKMLVKA